MLPFQKIATASGRFHAVDLFLLYFYHHGQNFNGLLILLLFQGSYTGFQTNLWRKADKVMEPNKKDEIFNKRYLCILNFAKIGIPGFRIPIKPVQKPKAND